MFLVVLVCLSVCLFVRLKKHYSKSYKRIVMKFYGRFGAGIMKN